MTLKRVSEVIPSSLRVPLLVGALGAHPALAEDPASEAPAAVSDQTAQSVRTVVLEGDFSIGGGVNTLDLGTAQVRDYSPLFLDLTVEGGARWGVGYLGGSVEGRLGSGVGFSALEVEAGLRLLDSRFGVDVGFGPSWNPLDGTVSNIDGVPHASLDLSARPFSGVLSPMQLECSVGSTFPPDSNFHPAYMDLNCGIGLKGQVKLPELDLAWPNTHTRAEANQPTNSSSAEKVAIGVSEFPTYRQIAELEKLISQREAKLQELAQNFYLLDPGLQAGKADYLKAQTEPRLLNEIYFKKTMTKEGDREVVVPVAVSDYELSQMSAEEKKKLYLISAAFRSDYLTADSIPDSTEALVSFDSNNEMLGYFESLDAYIEKAFVEAQLSVDPALLSKYVLLGRLRTKLEADIEGDLSVNKLRFKAYQFAQSEERKRAEYTHLAAQDRTSCAEDPACVAQSEEVRLSGELRNGVGPGVPDVGAALRFYRQMQEQEKKGAFLSVVDYENAYTAALAAGRIDLAISINEGLLLRKYSPGALEQKAYLEQNFGSISINDSLGAFQDAQYDSFGPVTRQAVEYASAQLQKTGNFEGYLPIGTYTTASGVHFEIKPGAKNKSVR